MKNFFFFTFFQLGFYFLINQLILSGVIPHFFCVFQTDSHPEMEFPEAFNQLELLDTHGHLIPRGARSSWTASKDDDTEVDEEDRSEEWYQKKEDMLKDQPKELVLWAAEHNLVSA